MALNALGGVSAGAIFLMLPAELIRQQQWNERRRGWGGEPYSWWRRHDEYGMSPYCGCSRPGLILLC
jgi:hypothetical protein